MPNTTTAPLSDKIIALASRPCGMTSADIPESTPEAVCTRAAQLIKKGRLHKVKVSHRSVCFFASKTHADAFAAELAAAQISGKRLDKQQRRASRSDRPMDNTNNVQPIEVPGYPGFDTRFAVTGPIVGGFKTMGIGRYLEA